MEGAQGCSDVEVGSFLSSGVDSSSYVAASVSTGTRPFTVGFDYEKYNEIDYAKALVRKNQNRQLFSKLVSSEGILGCDPYRAVPHGRAFGRRRLRLPSTLSARTASEQVKACTVRRRRR